jgi:hypothetical protein
MAASVHISACFPLVFPAEEFHDYDYELVDLQAVIRPLVPLAGGSADDGPDGILHVQQGEGVAKKAVPAKLQVGHLAVDGDCAPCAKPILVLRKRERCEEDGPLVVEGGVVLPSIEEYDALGIIRKKFTFKSKPIRMK